MQGYPMDSKQEHKDHELNMAASEMDRLQQMVQWTRDRLPDPNWRPRLGIVCGSGLGGLCLSMEPIQAGSGLIEFPYEDMPHISKSTVAGHAGKWVMGVLGRHRVPTVCMVGRFHFYEGHSMMEVTRPIRLMHLLGIKILLVTNAAGSLNPEQQPVGSVMLLRDHVNVPGMAGHHPLRGPNLSELGPRFPAVSDAYDPQLRLVARQVATQGNWFDSPFNHDSDTTAFAAADGIVSEGIYAYVAGPSYETPAEARFLRLLGADVVGMSTVPEVVVARHCGMRVLGMSLVTNLVVMTSAPVTVVSAATAADSDNAECVLSGPVAVATHDEVLETSRRRATQLQAYVCGIVDRCHEVGLMR